MSQRLQELLVAVVIAAGISGFVLSIALPVAATDRHDQDRATQRVQYVMQAREARLKACMSITDSAYEYQCIEAVSG